MHKYVAKYFLKTARIIREHRPKDQVVMQFFQRHNGAILCGMNEVLAFLKAHTDTSLYTIKYLPNGSIINDREVVLELTGPYPVFGIYEGVIDGILARSTSLASNARAIKQTTTKPVIFMGDRADHYLNQARDGYAVHTGGISTQVTAAHISQHSGQAVGTVPHALIQAFNGDLIKALRLYHRTFPTDKLVALVDFHNDVLKDTLEALATFKSKLYAIRIDTAPNLKDKMFSATEKEYGVTPEMVKRVRQALDQNGGEDVKIIISSGLDIAKIKSFEASGAPVDIYGVGASLLQINHHFTADAVMLNGKKVAKTGRRFQLNKRLVTY